ncbi:MAG: hypothetical protein ACXWTU_00480 [Methylotenera sp.]
MIESMGDDLSDDLWELYIKDDRTNSQQTDAVDNESPPLSKLPE